MNLADIKQKIAPLLLQYGVKRAAVFGSMARGEGTADSDVDLLIELEAPLGLFKYARLNYLLEDLLERKVDLVKNTAIKAAFKSTILREAVYIYGQ